MSTNLSLAQLNELAQEIANQLGHISQDLLVKIHALVTEQKSETVETEVL